jgi:hypothetical protein
MMTRLLVALMRLLVSPTPLAALLPHCLLSSLVAPPARPPSLFFSCRCTRSPSYLAFHGGKVDLSGYLYGEVFLGYEILYGRVSPNDEIHAGGVASLATSSSMVARLLHRQE